VRTLGVVLAGGRSSRFGSDKAEARLFGRTLLEHALEALRPQCEAVAVVGRETALAPSLADWPGPDEGPLGGLAGALRYARGVFYQLLTVSIDAPLLPADLRLSLEPGPSYLAGQPVIGLWPVDSVDQLDAILLGPGKHSMHAFAAAIGARPVGGVTLPANINRPADLAALESSSAVP